METFFGMLPFILFCLYGLTLHQFRFSAPDHNPTRPGGLNKLLIKNLLGMEAFFGMLPFIPFTYIHSDFVAPCHNPTRPGGGGQ